jgi:hypothetical protein
MTTALTVFDTPSNGRVYTYAGHTAQEPHLVIQKRKTPSGAEGTLEDVVTISSYCEDADGVALANRASIQIAVRRPKLSDAAFIQAVLAVAVDVIAGDEFANMVDSQEYLT